MITSSEPIKIACIEPSGNLYGSELAMLEILEGLDSSLFDVEVHLPAASPFARCLADRAIRFSESLPTDPASCSRLVRIGSYVRLLRVLHRARPHLLYVNQAGILRPMAPIARLLRIPVVCQIQTIEDARWISRCPAAHSVVRSFICNSDFTAEHADVSTLKKCVVYLGYKWKGLSRPQPNSHRSVFTVGLLGRISTSKGHDLVIAAAERLSACSEENWRFRFIGEAPTVKEGEYWVNEVARRGLQGMIEFRGYRSDVGIELSEMDLLIIPSRAEPFGRIVCEACEAGVPVLLSDSGGLGELSHRFGIGVRHEPENVTDICRKVEYIRDNYDSVATEFREAVPGFLKALDYETYVDTIGHILQEAVMGRNVSQFWRGKESSP